MTINKYVPDEEQVREAWRAFTGPNRDHGFGTWLARVRRDAKAEAWDEACEAFAWCITNGPIEDALPYVAEHNPHRETGDQR